MADIIIDSDSGKLKAGADQDLEVYNDGSHSYISGVTAGQNMVFATRPSGGSTTTAITVDSDGNIILSAGATYWNTGVVNHANNLFGGAWTSGGVGTTADGLRATIVTTGHSGDSTRLSQFTVNGSIVTAGSTALASTAAFYEPTITVGSGTVTNSATLYIDGAADEATNNYALWVDSGDSKFDGYIVNEQGRSDHVANTMPSPYYRFDGVNDKITVTNNAALNLGLGDFSFCISIRPREVSNEFLFGKYEDSSNKWNLRISGGKPNIYAAVGGSATFEYITNDALINEDTNYHICFVCDRDGTKGQFYVDGAAVATTETTATVATTLDNTGALYIGSESVTFANAEISNYSQWNRALSATEVKELYSGASVPFKYKGASQTVTYDSDFTSDVDGWADGWSDAGVSADTGNDELDVTAGGGLSGSWNTGSYKDIGMTVGKRYRLIWTVVNYSANHAGVLHHITYNEISNVTANGTYTVEFTAENAGLALAAYDSGDTFSITDMSVTPIGAVAEYDGSGIGKLMWDDKSGNDLHGTVSGATVENAPADADSGLTYEEGSWTPAFDNLTEGSATITGKYTKIGNLVYVQGSITWAADTSASGSITVTNLPFTVANDIAPIGNSYLTDAGTGSFFGKVKASVNSTTLALQETNTAAGAAGNIEHNSPFTWTTNDVLFFEITYRT